MICRKTVKVFEIFTSPESFEAVSEALKNQPELKMQAAEVSMIPQNYIHLEGADAKQMLKLYEAIEDNDDVAKRLCEFRY